jgi:hypothetical protein
MPDLGQERKRMDERFASAGLTAGQLNAIVKKLGGHEMALKFLRGELSVSEPVRSWYEEDGVIYFSVISDGTTGAEWVERLEAKRFQIGSYAKSILRSPDFKPTNGVTTKIAVLKGALFGDDDRITKKIRIEARKRLLTDPYDAEVACLIREKFSDEEIKAMGLWWIIVMHNPIKDSDGDPRLLGVRRDGDGRWLHAYYDRPVVRWSRDDGFAFAVSQD